MINNQEELKGILQSISVRLNVNMNNLSRKAIAQLIVKIVYLKKNISKQGIKDELASINDSRHISSNEIDEILAELVPNELKCHKGSYTISATKRRSIKESIDAARERDKIILDTYFNELNTDTETISRWLVDVTIRFFESYSEEWISDVVALTNSVKSSISSIMSMIEKRTKSFPNIDRDDRDRLPTKYRDFIMSSDKNVEEFLWDYGTSAFASKLIRIVHGVDQLTMETFRNSVCVLDTNILMFIALESRYKEALNAIEKVFNDLGVEVKILYITQREYENKITYQRNITLHNFEKYGNDIAMLPNDDFTKYLKQSYCKTENDIKNAFDFSLRLPEYIKDNIKIELLDSDIQLNEIIENAKNNINLKNELNSLYQEYVNHGKTESALNHDIGLIEGVKYLRNNYPDSKYYIMSEDIAINQYSKKHGFKNNLPLSLRVDTLINILAVNNGGDTFNAEDYKSLFANMIRLELVPPRDTFRQTELYQFYQMNANIAKLPLDITQDIVLKMHDKIIKGEDEENLHRDLEEMITKGEVEVTKRLSNTENELYLKNNEIERISEENKTVKSLLIEQIKNEVTQNYDIKTKRIRRLLYFLIPIIVIVISIIVVLLSYFKATEPNLITSVIVSILTDAILGGISICIGKFKILKERESKRIKHIKEETNRRYNEKIKSSKK